MNDKRWSVPADMLAEAQRKIERQREQRAAKRKYLKDKRLMSAERFGRR